MELNSGRTLTPPGWREHLGALRPDRAVSILALASVALHVATSAGYGIFRDEMYYLACGNHLAWGYVDHPPLVALIAWLCQRTLGDSLTALRLAPALAAGGVVLLTGSLARQLGGERDAQLLAGLAVALAPIYLALASILSMNAIDILVWTATVVVVSRTLVSGDRRLWLVFGALAGIGLQNKLSMLFLGFGVAVGLLFAREWQHLRSRYLWLGGVLSALIFAPHLAWQAANGWPTAEFIQRAATIKNVAFSPMEFLTQQTLQMNPLTLPLWAAGLVFLIVGRQARSVRALGWAFVAVLAVMLSRSAKPYYLAPAYPILFAAGAVLVERLSARRPWLVRSAIVLVGVSGSALAPIAKPLLPVDSYVAYRDALGLAPGTDERKELDRLPQFFADMHGWEDMARAVAGVYAALPSEERKSACVFGQNYGQAGAIDYFRGTYELPPAISGHNNYWLWGPGSCSGDVLIIIGGDRSDHEGAFESVSEAARFDCTDCMPYEDDQPLFVARGLQAPIAQVWPQTRHFD
jgi:hypothetical protein